MSRTRLIRPEFFADELLSALPDPVRLFYIGLWTLCDDAGYFECKPRQIAAALYPYRGKPGRERLTDKGLVALQAIGRVKLLECGVHGVVPTLPKHGAKGGTKSETYRSRHVTTCLSVGVRTNTDKSSSVSGLGMGSDSVSESARETTIDDAALAAGGFAARHAGRRLKVVAS